jgi:hypothetical protein
MPAFSPLCTIWQQQVKEELAGDSPEVRPRSFALLRMTNPWLSSFALLRISGGIRPANLPHVAWRTSGESLEN